MVSAPSWPTTIDIGSPAPSNNPPTWVQGSWQLLQNFWTTAKHSGTSVNNSNVSNVYHTNSTKNCNQIETAKTKTNVFSNGLLFLPEKSMIHRLKLSCYCTCFAHPGMWHSLGRLDWSRTAARQLWGHRTYFTELPVHVHSRKQIAKTKTRIFAFSQIRSHRFMIKHTPNPGTFHWFMI